MKVIKVIIAVIIISAAGYFSYRAFFVSKSPGYEFIEVKRGEVIEELFETGKVIPPEEINLYFKNPGQVSEVKVREGDRVEMGMLLMRTDIRELAIKEREAEAALASAQAKYNQALAGAAEEEIKVYQTALDNAQKNLEETKKSSAESVVAAQKEVDSAQTAYNSVYESLKNTLRANIVTVSAALTDIDNILGVDNRTANDAFEDNLGAVNFQTKIDAENYYKDAKSAKESASNAVAGLINSPSQSAIDLAASATKISLNKVIAALEKTKLMLDYSTTGSTFTLAELNAKKSIIDTDRTSSVTALTNLEAGQQNIALANNTLEVAQAKLASVQATASANIAAAEGVVRTASDQLSAKKAPLRDVDKAVYQAAIAQAKANLDLVRQQINEASLYAPISGVITDIGLKAGELATTLTRAVSMISADLEITADVSELDIRKIKINNPITVSFDALEGEVFSGKITKIAPREKLKDEDIYYKVTMVLSEAPLLKSGMTADISIKIGEKSDVLVIPERILIKRGGRYFVQVLKNGELSEKEIKIGLRGEDVVEVENGLREGEKVVAGIK